MPLKTVIAGLLLATVVATVMWMWRGDRSVAADPAATQSLPSLAKESSAPASSGFPTQKDFHGVSYERGLLSVDVAAERLGPILVDIARRSATTIFSEPTIDARVVTIKLRDVPLEQGLRSLLGDCDVFAYSSAGQLRTLWAYEHGAGSGFVPIPPESWASTAEFERKLNAGSPSERILAIETIVARNGSNALETVNRALTDADAEVRLRALDVALSAGVSIPPETLTMLTSDASLALEAIVNGTERGSAREAETLQLIHRMLADPDSEVRKRAQEMLEERGAS
jgi:hypothetical protein